LVGGGGNGLGIVNWPSSVLLMWLLQNIYLGGWHFFDDCFAHKI
jgi:hypothetical protein